MSFYLLVPDVSDVVSRSFECTTVGRPESLIGMGTGNGEIVKLYFILKRMHITFVRRTNRGIPLLGTSRARELC